MELSRTYQELALSFEDDPDYILHGLLYEIAEEICAAMQEQGLTQAELAARAGMKPPALCRFLRTPSNTTLRTVVRLAVALNVDVGEILTKATARAMRRRRPMATAQELEEGLLRPAASVGAGAGAVWRPHAVRQFASSGILVEGDTENEHSQLNAAT